MENLLRFKYGLLGAALFMAAADLIQFVGSFSSIFVTSNLISALLLGGICALLMPKWHPLRFGFGIAIGIIYEATRVLNFIAVIKYSADFSHKVPWLLGSNLLFLLLDFSIVAGLLVVIGLGRSQRATVS